MDSFSASRPARGWAWHCTDASMVAGQVSVVAVAEVFASVTLYWWISGHFGWPLFSMVGLVAAPMLLLRSRASVELGVEMLSNWYAREPKKFTDRQKSILAFASMAVSFATIFLITSSLARAWLPGHDGWALFWRAGILDSVGVLTGAAIAIAVAVTVAAAMGGALTDPDAFAGIVAVIDRARVRAFQDTGGRGETVESGGASGLFVGAIAAAFAVALADADAGVLVVAIAVAGAGVGAVAVPVAFFVAAAAEAVRPSDRLSAVSAALVFVFRNAIFYPIMVTGLASGVALRVLAIRLFATLRHPISGLRELPRNWRETLWVIDFLHAPELVPQAARVDAFFTVRGLAQTWTEFDNMGRGYFAILFPVWYLPTLAYRWSLKASAWLWWPLALGLSPTPQKYELRDEVALISRGLQGWLLNGSLALVLAWLTLSFSPNTISVLKQFWPALAEQAVTLLAVLPPPSPTRLGLIVLAAALAGKLWIANRNLLASHDKVLGSDKEYRDLSEEERHRFDSRARRVKRVQLALVMTLVFLTELSALAFFNGRNPEVVVSKVWPWLLRLL